MLKRILTISLLTALAGVSVASAQPAEASRTQRKAVAHAVHHADADRDVPRKTREAPHKDRDQTRFSYAMQVNKLPNRALHARHTGRVSPRAKHAHRRGEDLSHAARLAEHKAERRALHASRSTPAATKTKRMR